MANRKISALSDAAALSGTEQLAGVQSGGNVKITPEQIKTYVAKDNIKFLSNVGIGSSDPNAQLDVNTSGANATIQVRVNTANNVSFRLIRTVSTPTDWEMYSPAASSDLRFYNGGDKFVLTAGGALKILTVPTNDDTAAQILARNSTTGEIEYRTASSLVGGSTVTDGTWTPTLTNTSNITSSVAFLCTYLRVGNTVTIGGQVRVVPTSTGVVCILHMTIPIASAFATGNECGGTAVAVDISLANQAARISADTATGKITLRYAPSNTNTHNFDFTATYRII